MSKETHFPAPLPLQQGGGAEKDRRMVGQQARQVPKALQPTY